MNIERKGTREMNYNPMLAFDNTKNGVALEQEFLELAELIEQEGFVKYDGSQKSFIAAALISAATNFASEEYDVLDVIAFLKGVRDRAESERLKLLSGTEQRNP